MIRLFVFTVKLFSAGVLGSYFSDDIPDLPADFPSGGSQFFHDSPQGTKNRNIPKYRILVGYCATLGRSFKTRASPIRLLFE